MFLADFDNIRSLYILLTKLWGVFEFVLEHEQKAGHVVRKSQAVLTRVKVINDRVSSKFIRNRNRYQETNYIRQNYDSDELLCCCAKVSSTGWNAVCLC